MFMFDFLTFFTASATIVEKLGLPGVKSFLKLPWTQFFLKTLYDFTPSCTYAMQRCFGMIGEKHG